MQRAETAFLENFLKGYTSMIGNVNFLGQVGSEVFLVKNEIDQRRMIWSRERMQLI
jgi:hypothetical protein